VSFVMALRLVSYSPPAEVVPLRPVTSTGAVAEDSPEPHQLYHLIVLALLLHQPTLSDGCRSCAQPWPCEQVRLACRLRDGF
jgi:hypothetical protein